MKNVLKWGAVIFISMMFGYMIGQTPTSSEIKSSSTSSNQEVEETVEKVTETKPAGKVEVKSEKSQVTRIGHTEVIGEVINNTDKPVTYVKVTATFYDEAGDVIGTGFTYAGDTSNTPLEPGNTTPFEVSSFPDELDVDNYKLDVTWK